MPFDIRLWKLSQEFSQPQCTRSPCSPDTTFPPSLPPQPPHTSPSTFQAVPITTHFVPSGSTRDEGVYENAIETCSSVNTLNLETIMPGPEDYAIESLATSLMGGTAEATTETFYTGKHMSVNMINFRRDETLE